MAINYKKYGAFIRDQRKRMQYSQKEVYQLTGISIETQRLLENGHREPRIITIERLSELYKVDLIHGLYHHRTASDFFSETFLEAMWTHFNTRDYEGFICAIDTLVQTIKNEYLGHNQKSKSNIKFIESLELLKELNFEKHKYDMSSSVFYEQLLIYLSKDKLYPLSDPQLYYLEIQVGLLLSFIYRQRSEFAKSEKTVTKLIKSLENDSLLTPRQMDYLATCYYNLCLVYHREDKDQLVIDTVTTLLKRDDLRFKRIFYNELLFRLAIAYYKTNRINYQHILANILLTETPSRAAEIYERLKNSYSINAEDFMTLKEVAGFENLSNEKG